MWRAAFGPSLEVRLEEVDGGGDAVKEVPNYRKNERRIPGEFPVNSPSSGTADFELAAWLISGHGHSQRNRSLLLRTSQLVPNPPIDYAERNDPRPR